MTPKEIADRLVELYNEGKSLQAESELYAPKVESLEQDPSRNATGLEAIQAKTKAAGEMFQHISRNLATIVGVNNDSFLIHFDVDAIGADDKPIKMQEYGFYKVADGKVVQEYFFFI
jgi:hypothetical protein